MRVLLASRSRQSLDALLAALAAVDSIECLPQLLGNGHGDALREPPLPAEALVLHVSPDTLELAERLATTAPANRLPLLLVGPADDTEAMRMAIRCGARDFLPEPLVAADLVAALARIRAAGRAAGAAHGQITVFLGAAGGIGTSLLAANVAHRHAIDGERTILVDLDLVCAPLPALFDLDPPLGLLEALAVLETLDPAALDGYVGRHASGLRVLAATGSGLVFDGDVAADRLVALLRVLAAEFGQVVVDAGCRLTPLTLAAAGAADRTVLVMQQSVANVRNAVRLQQALGKTPGDAAAAPLVVINRYLRGAAVTIADVQRALVSAAPLLVPNDYRLAHESCDTGVPLVDAAGSAPLTRAIASLAAALTGRAPAAPRGFLERALPLFGRRSS